MRHILLSAIAALAIAQSAHAAFEVTNGDFTTPAPTPGSWNNFGATIPGWKSEAGGGIEIWSATFTGSPANQTPNFNGTDFSNGAGFNHMELNLYSAGISTTDPAIVVPAGVSKAVLSFAAWTRGSVPLPGVLEGTVEILKASGNITVSIASVVSKWTQNQVFFDVVGNESVDFRFSSTGDGANSIHIGNVTLAAVPEPTTIVVWSGLAAIGGIVAYRRRVAA